MCYLYLIISGILFVFLGFLVFHGVKDPGVFLGAVLATVCAIIGFFTPVREELYCNKKDNVCIVTSRYLTGKEKKKNIADYNSIIGAEVVLFPSFWRGLFFKTSNNAKIRIFNRFTHYTDLAFDMYRLQANYLNSAFARQSEEIRLKHNDYLE